MRALLVIDLQQGMFAIPGLPPHDGEAKVARIAALLGRAREAAAPVVFVQHQGGPGHPLAAGTPGFAVRAEVAPREGEALVVKRRCSAFQDTGLDELLRTAGIDDLVICGLQTELCVDTAVRAAAERGLGVTLVADGHTTFDTPGLGGAAIVAHHNRLLEGTFARLAPAASLWAD